MTYAAVTARTRQRGRLEYGLLIHGLPYVFTTGGAWANPTTITGITGNLTPLRVLRVGGIEEMLELDPKDWNLKAANLTFRFVDARDALGKDQVLTPIFGLGVGGVTSTRLAATLTDGDGPIKVDDVSAFPTSGDVYIGLETIGYAATSVPANPDEIQTLTRGKYGSRETTHIFLLDAGGVRPEGDIRPLVTSKPISLYGRRCTLYVRESKSDGTLDAPEIRYRGRILGSVKCDGAEWEIPTESIWTAIDSNIPSRSRGSQLREVAFGRDQRVRWRTLTLGTTNTVTLTQRRFNGAADLVAYFCREMTSNGGATGLRDTGATDNDLSGWVLAEGRTVWRISDDGGSTTEELELEFLTGELGTALGFTAAMEWRVGKYIIYAIGSLASTETYTAQAGVFYGFPPDVAVDVGVADAALFSAFSVVSEASGYDVRSYVLIGDFAYRLLSVNVGASTIAVAPFGNFSGWQAVEDDRRYQHSGEPPIEVREFVYMRGVWWRCWQALVEDLTIAQDFKGFLETTDFDWTAIQAASEHAPAIGANRYLFEPTSFRDLLLEDFSVRGLLPTISAGKVSALPLRAPGLLESSFAVDRGVILADVMLRMTRSRERILNALVYKWRWDPQAEEFRAPTVQVNDAESQHDAGVVHERVIQNRGLDWETDDAEAEIFASATSFLALFGRDYGVVEVPVTIGAALVVPGDVVTLTDKSVPNAVTGRRGVTSLQCLVLGVKVKPYSARGQLTVLVVSDGLRRSGFAPAARMTAFVDNGAPAGDKRFEIQVAANDYATAQNNALYFLAGMKVQLRGWDTITPTLETNTVSPAGSEVLTGIGRIYLTAAPVAAVPGTLSRIRFNLYGTASQTQAAKDYLHVADETTGKIGGTGDPGFHPS